MNVYKQLIKLFRLKQWVKNIIIFAPLIFAQKLGHPDDLVHVVYAFLAFSFVASGLYIMNDILDKKADQNHPIKKNRPIASGAVSVQTGLFWMTGLFLAGGVGAYLLGTLFFTTVFGYTILVTLYSAWLKQIVLLDSIVISIGFVLRAIAGAVVISVEFSSWLLVTTFFLSLFLTLGKRRHEVLLLGDGASKHRSILPHYPKDLIDQLVVLSGTVTLVSITLYMLSEETVGRFGTTNLIYSLPFVVYGLFRYFYIVYKKQSGGDPTETLYTDIPLLLSVIVWGLSVIVIIY